MPELPDIELYAACLRPRVIGAELRAARIRSPSLLRSVDPPIDALEGTRVAGVERLGKRIVLAFEDDCFLVLHLMIAGRLRWRDGTDVLAARPSPIESAELRFSTGTLVVTEASTQKRATLTAVRGRANLRELDPGGLEPLASSASEFVARLRVENRTLKRALTDPRLFAGIGNAYSDEILHAARLSPVTLTSRVSDEAATRLFEATRAVLGAWTSRLIEEFRGRFPDRGDVTAFRPEFAVHGRFGEPCRACGARVQRIVRGDHETNYCPTCQTGGKILADRSLSRLLNDDWPGVLEE